MPCGKCLSLTIALGCLSCLPAKGQERAETGRWDEAMRAFAALDQQQPPAPQGLLFVGSSTIRLWKTAESFPQWKVLNRGFGGSQIADVNQYFDQVVAAYQPRVIVFYSGDNDVAAGKSAEQVAQDFAAFLDRVRQMSPATRVVFLPIKPSVKRWDKWPIMRDANSRIRGLLEQRQAGIYVDTATAMLGGDGQPRAELFLADGLHLNAAGYELWDKILSPVLAGEMKLLAVARQPALRDSLRFYASFDKSADADVARGDRRIYTASDLKRTQVEAGLQTGEVRLVEQGKWGGCLQFGRKTEQVVFYRGQDNLPYQADSFSGTVSLWMSLAPDQDLEPGYVDPLQITDKAWNNAAFFIDFSKDEKPRHFRLGVFSDYAFWNPTNRDWNAIPVAERPMVTVEQPPFRRETWTHVAFTYHNFNTDQPAEAVLYLDGKSQGQLTSKQHFTWDPAQVAMFLGIYYTGRMDDLAVFDRALTPDEIQQLRSAPAHQP